MPSMLTNRGRMMALDASLLLLTHTIKAMLLNNAYVPDKDHQYASALSTFEISGVGYASGFGGTGRKTLASKVVGKNDTTDVAFFDCADVTWAGLRAGTVGYVALIREVTSNADSPVLGVIELPVPVVTDGAAWTWVVPAAGAFVW